MINPQVLGAIQRVIVEKISSRDKIKRLAMSVGLDLSEFNGSKSEMAEKITSHAKDNLELISIVLDYAKRGSWDKDYSKEARDKIIPVFNRTMGLTVNDIGQVVPVAKFGVKRVNPDNAGESKYHIFISHSTKDLGLVMKLVNELNFYGLRSFVAHKDIKVATEWLTEIENQLNKCKVFIAFLTANFKASDWCDQEAGIAYLNNLKIIPLNCDGATNSYGFLAKFQTTHLIFEVDDRNQSGMSKFKNDVRNIVDVVLGEKEIIEFTRSSILNQVEKIHSYSHSDCIFSLIPKLEPFTEEEVKQLIKLSVNNSQIYGAVSAQEPLKEIISKYYGVLSGMPETKELMTKIGF
jgi:hypothetical protein